MGSGTGSTLKKTRAEYKTEADSIKVKDLIRLFTEFFMPKRNTYHNRGDSFWAKQTEEESPEEFWRRLIEIEKERNFNTISAEELLISKCITAITDKKLRDKIMKEKTLELKKVIELIKQNTYEKKNKRNTIPEALISTKKTSHKGRTNTRNGTIPYETEKLKFRKPNMQILYRYKLDTNA